MTLPTFPSLPGITYPVKSTLQWSTVQQDALSGKRTRYPLWTFPIHKWDIPVSFLRTDASIQEWQTLVGFINSVQGSAGLWQYDDPTDDSVTAQEFGLGDDATKAFQLVRSLGGFTEPVFLPVLTAGLVTQVTVAGTPTTAYTISAYGALTFTSAPANGAALQWTGSYRWPVRFDDDTTDLSLFVSNIYEAKSLKFSSEKLP